MAKPRNIPGENRVKLRYPGRPAEKPTPMQKAAVDNLLSGEYKAVAPAMRDAGYSKSSSLQSHKALIGRRGVQNYIKTLSAKAQKRWNTTIEDKVLDTYLDGLEATKLYGKNAIPHPDFMARKAFADRFAGFFGWVREGGLPTGSYQQINFFEVAREERRQFNENFKGFLRDFYK